MENMELENSMTDITPASAYAGNGIPYYDNLMQSEQSEVTEIIRLLWRQTFLLEAEHVAPHRVPLDLTVASVDRYTMAHQTCTFRELLDGDATTEQLVVTFLAMLELAKRGSLTLSQDEIFGTICINRVEGAEAYVPGEGPELTE